MNDRKATEQARAGLERAERGETEALRDAEEARRTNPPAAEAVEQEASEGPEGRGLAR